MGRLVVADAGPLIAFGRIGKLGLLQQTFGEILIPKQVVDECLHDKALPGAAAIQSALDQGVLLRATESEPVLPPFPMLDAGESAAIRLALKLSVPVLIDEKAGRKIAENLGLKVIGSLGVLLGSKRQGHLDTIRPILDAFQANGYHVSAALVRAALIRAGEGV